PGGPTPYGDTPILQGRGNTFGMPTRAPPVAPAPGAIPPGPMPYIEPAPPQPGSVPPPPPPGPGLGSSRRTNENFVVPQPPSLMQPLSQNGPNHFGPPVSQPTAFSHPTGFSQPAGFAPPGAQPFGPPPTGAGIAPVANFQPYP